MFTLMSTCSISHMQLGHVHLALVQLGHVMQLGHVQSAYIQPMCSCAASYQQVREASAFLLSMDVVMMLLKLKGRGMTIKMSDNGGIDPFHKA